MAVEIPDGFIQIVLEWNAHSGIGSQPVTVLGYQVDQGAVGFDFGDVCQAAADALVQASTDSWEIIGAIVRLGATGGPPYASFPQAVAATGVVTTGDAVSPNVAALIAKLTLTPGRPGRGRCYVPGLPEEDIGTDGSVVGSSVARLLTVASDLGAVTDLPGVIASVLLHPVGSPLADSPSIITQFLPSGIVATQRRRLRR